MQLDKNIAESQNFIFRIENTISVKSVLLDILIGSIIFHIVPINILFLFCLAKINKLETFFNNITI